MSAGKKVLVIDDDPVTVRLLERVIGNHGYEVQSVHNGWEGLQAYKSFQPDLIVLDILMPVMDGYDFLAEFRRIGSLAETPIIVLTVYDTLKERLTAEGIDDYLVKPFKMTDLVDRIDQRLAKHDG